MTPWDILGIEPTPDERVIKRAYAKLLKQTRPDTDKDGFIRLREAYERALVIREWLDEDDDDRDAADEDTGDLGVRADVAVPAQVIPASVPGMPEPVVQPISLHWQQEPGQPAPPPIGLPSTDPLFARLDPLTPPPPAPLPVSPPVRTATDYPRGWDQAAGSEEMLLARLRADLGEDALLHIERRGDYERAFLVWLLKRDRTYPEVFKVALAELHWNEKWTLWPEWPWDQLDSYRQRCLVDDFFEHPANYEQDLPLLSRWLVNRAAAGGRLRGLINRLPFDRVGLRAELARFEQNYGHALASRPAYRQHLDALRAQLAAPILDPVWSLIVSVGIFSSLGSPVETDQPEVTIGGYLLSAALGLYGASQLYLKHVHALLTRSLSVLLTTPPWPLAQGLLIMAALTGLPALALERFGSSASTNLSGVLDFSACLGIAGLAITYARVSDWIATGRSPVLRRALMPGEGVKKLLIASVPTPLVLAFLDLPATLSQPLVALPMTLGLFVPVCFWLTAIHIVHRYGPGIPRRFVGYLAFTLFTVGVIALNFGEKDAPYMVTPVAWLLLLPLILRTRMAPAEHDARNPGWASMTCKAVFGFYLLGYGLLSYELFDTLGYVTGLVVCASLVWLLLYGWARASSAR